jgi:PAS domain S-box-containing protein
MEFFRDYNKLLFHKLETKMAELQNEKEFLKNIFESLTHPFYVIDASDQAILIANPAASKNNLTAGSKCFELTHHRKIPCSNEEICPLEEVKKTKKAVTVEHVHFDKEGDPRNVEVHGYPIFDKEGKVVQMIEYCLDITERKLVEDAFQESSKRYHALFEQAGDGIFMLDTKGKILSVNETFAHMHGLSTEEIVQIGLEKLDVEGITKVPERMHRIIAGETLSFEVEHYHKDGHIFPLLVTANLISTGNEQFIIAIHRDLTERKRAEDALRESETRLREAQKIAHIGNWELNLLTNTLIWSDEIFRIFEIDKERFGASYEAFLDAIHPEDRDAVNSAYIQSLEIRKAYEITHRLLMRDGRIKYVQEQCDTYYSPGGKPLRSIGIVQDTAHCMIVHQMRSCCLMKNAFLTATMQRC